MSWKEFLEQYELQRGDVIDVGGLLITVRRVQERRWFLMHPTLSEHLAQVSDFYRDGNAVWMHTLKPIVAYRPEWEIDVLYLAHGDPAELQSVPATAIRLTKLTPKPAPAKKGKLDANRLGARIDRQLRDGNQALLCQREETILRALVSAINDQDTP